MVLTFAFAVPQMARADWKTLVVGQPGPGATLSFADAFHASQAFERGGLPILDIIRDLPRARLTDRLAALEDTPRLILFYSGRLNSGSISMNDGTMPLSTVLQSAAAAGTQELILMIENCAAQHPEPAQVIVPEPPAGVTLQVISSAPASGQCISGARLSDQLQALASQGALTGPLLERLDGLDITGSVPTPVVMPGPQDIAPDGFEATVQLLPEDVILVAPVDASSDDVIALEELADEDFIEVLLPARVPDLIDNIVENEPVVTFAALPQAQIAALPIAAGLPEPSIIVGLLEGVTDAALELDAPTEEDSGSALAWNDLDARRALRQNNPEIFASLLASGALDPPSELLAVALQGELQRMNCYKVRIDGDWGPRSRGAAQQYFDQLEDVDTPASGVAASIELFRMILRNDDVECPEVQTVSRPRSTGTTNRAPARATTNNTRSAPAQSAPARTTAPARSTSPARTPSRSGSGFNSGGFGGVFR